MKQLKFFLPLLILLSSFCNNEENPNVTEELTSGKWILVSDLLDASNTGVFEEQLDDCNLDDTWDFKEEGKYYNSEETILCSPDQGAIDGWGTWNLSEDETELTMTTGGDVVIDELKFKIITITSTKLVVHAISPNNGPTWEKITLKR